jgi:hypothetical protein
MTAGPGVSEIVAAVKLWLEGGADNAQGFHGKVAANALAIAQRELDHWPAAEARAVARLEAITGRAGSFDDLEALLCAMLRDGEVAVADSRVREHLRATAADRLAIDQPSYRSLLG